MEREAFLYKIMASGCGYMANTSHKRKDHNVKVLAVHPHDPCSPNELFYIATRRIAAAAGEEMISPYQWHKLVID